MYVCRSSPILRIRIWSHDFAVLVFVERGKQESGEKPFGTEKRTNNTHCPLMTPGAEDKPELHWWEASALNTTSSLLLRVDNQRAN